MNKAIQDALKTIQDEIENANKNGGNSAAFLLVLDEGRASYCMEGLGEDLINLLANSFRDEQYETIVSASLAAFRHHFSNKTLN